MLVKIAVASLCHTDGMVSNGDFETKLPCIPSHEGSGTVVSPRSRYLIMPHRRPKSYNRLSQITLRFREIHRFPLLATLPPSKSQCFKTLTNEPGQNRLICHRIRGRRSYPLWSHLQTLRHLSRLHWTRTQQPVLRKCGRYERRDQRRQFC